ncbi:MAG: galactose oxidase, partial [Acidobacteriota bacterium]
MPEPVANNAVASATVDGRAFIFSFLGLGPGRDYSAITTRAYALDVARGQWEPIPDVPGDVGRLAATAQTIDDRVHVFGGYAVAADGRETTSPAVDIYDVRERRYTSGAPMPVP